MRGTDVETILVFGIDPQQEVKVSIIEQFVEGSSLQRLDTEQGAIILGGALAERMGLVIGDSTTLMVTDESSQGHIKPRYSRFRIAGIVNTGTEIDQGLALINIAAAQQLMGSTGALEGLRLMLKDTFEAPRVAWELEQNLPYGYSTRDWTRTHGNLYSAIQLSKQLVGLMLLTIIAVAAFNVVSALVMIVTDKQADIAILRSLGASSGGILSIFIIQGTMIGVIGTGLGALLGALLSLLVTDVVNGLEYLFHIQFLNSDVYPINYLPADLRLEDMLLVCSTALLMSVLATIYPAWRAVRVQPAEALRYH
jgi:lipoprotein-releasing system permease protein